MASSVQIIAGATARFNVLWRRFVLDKLEYNMNDLRLAFRAQAKPTFLEHFKHCNVVRQNLRDEFLEPGVTGNDGEMPHERSTDTMPLEFVNHGESYLRCAGALHDIASAANNYLPTVLLYHYDQCDMILKVDA